jgi:hypothetical protein|tara:strand:- start:4252 stop:4818 length:567 start_codon:yes stop_codon:yes gene_type:complete
MSDVWKEITADASAFDGLTKEAGTELSGLIRTVTGINKEISGVESHLSELKISRDRYLFDLIPNQMREIGLDKVEVDGNKVGLYTFVSGTMPKDPLQKAAALQHLTDIGCSDFIKNDVVIRFGVTKHNEAKSLQADLDEQGYQTTSKTWVEPMTLKKLIHERVENSQEIDLEMFSAYLGTKAKITKGS